MYDHGWPEFGDTRPEALRVWFDLLRRKPAGDKLKLVFDCIAMVRKMQEAGERVRDPSASEREVFLRAAARRLDAETMKKVYGWTSERRSTAGGT
jgi:hypothetical protein